MQHGLDKNTGEDNYVSKAKHGPLRLWNAVWNLLRTILLWEGDNPAILQELFMERSQEDVHLRLFLLVYLYRWCSLTSGQISSPSRINSRMPKGAPVLVKIVVQWNCCPVSDCHLEEYWSCWLYALPCSREMIFFLILTGVRRRVSPVN